MRGAGADSRVDLLYRLWTSTAIGRPYCAQGHHPDRPGEDGLDGRDEDEVSRSSLSVASLNLFADLYSGRFSSRTKFMLETLTNLKNNRVKAAPGGEAAAEATTRMKKFLSGLDKKKHGSSPFSLPLSLAPTSG